MSGEGPVVRDYETTETMWQRYTETGDKKAQVRMLFPAAGYTFDGDATPENFLGELEKMAGFYAELRSKSTKGESKESNLTDADRKQKMLEALKRAVLTGGHTGNAAMKTALVMHLLNNNITSFTKDDRLDRLRHLVRYNTRRGFYHFHTQVANQHSVFCAAVATKLQEAISNGFQGAHSFSVVASEEQAKTELQNVVPKLHVGTAFPLACNAKAVKTSQQAGPNFTRKFRAGAAAK
eukprot:3934405-Rhodomonas_salina.4